MTPHDFNPDALLLDRYVNGEVTEEERRVLEEWLRQNPEQQRALRALYRGVAAVYGAVPTYDVDARIAAIVDHGLRAARRARRQGPIGRAIPSKAGWTRFPLALSGGVRTLGWWGGISLALVLCIAGVFRVWPSHGSSLMPEARQVYATRNGQSATVHLADGTTVFLGPSSHLTTEVASATGFRTATIQGAAYFTVAPHPNQPFIVRTSRAVVRVLGTTFSVRQYPEEPVVQVAVVEGKVLLQSTNRTGAGSVVLSAAMLGVASDSGPVTATSPVALDDFTSWTQGRLVFHETPVRELIADLARAYDVDLRLRDSTLAAMHVTLTVSTNTESISTALDALTAAINAHYVRSGRTVTILPGRPAAPRNRMPSTFTPETSYGR